MRHPIHPWICLCAVALVVAAPTIVQGQSFSNQTAGVGISVTYGSSGFSHWDYTGGGSVGDFNNDGFQDIFIVSGGLNSQPDYLYINNGNGTFTDQAAAWGLTDVHLGKGTGVADYNADGLLDIFVTSAGPPGNAGSCNHRLYRNDGGSFTEVAAAAGVNCTSPSEDSFGCTWGDYNLDGNLDLFVSGFDSGNVGSKLFRNNGDGTFTDVTAASNFFSATPVSMAGFAPVFADMNDDWYPEVLYVADFGTSRYFRNNTDGTFTDITGTGWAVDENGMGQTIRGSFDNNLTLDTYTTSIYLPSNGWTGNKLYMKNGDHSFLETSVAANVHDGGYGWGTVAVDFDHDGLLDIAETNGGSSTGGTFGGEQAYLWMNNGNGTFTENAIASGLVHTLRGRGMANLDFDNDGDQEVFIVSNRDAVQFYRNDLSGAGTNWIRIFLDASSLPLVPPQGIGARVIVTVGGTSQLRYMTGGDSFLSHSERSAHFGLGSATSIDEIRIEWPDGSETTYTSVAANQTLTLGPDPTGIGPTDAPSSFSLDQNHPNPFNPTTAISFTLREASYVTISVFDTAGRRIKTLEAATRPAGTHQVSWDGRDHRGTLVSSGVYYYRLKAGNETQTKKMILLK